MKDTLKVRARRLALISIVAVVVCIGVFFAGGAQLIEKFNYLEREQELDVARRVERALDSDLHQLAVTTHDYAQSDSIYNFVQGGNPSYANSVLPYDTLSDLQVDVVWIIDAAGHELYSARVDDLTDAVSHPADAGLIAALQPYASRLKAFGGLAPHARLLRLPGGLLAFDAEEITRTDRSGASGALLLFGRFIEIDELERARETSQTSVDLVMLGSGAETNVLPEQATEWLRTAAIRDRYFTTPVSETQVRTTVLLRDVDGARIALLTWLAARDVSALGRRATTQFVGFFAAVLLVVSAIVGVLFLRLHRSLLAQYNAQQRYTNIIRNLDESVIIVERASLKIKEANPALQRRLDYTEDELAGCELQEIFRNLPLEWVRDPWRSQPVIRECQLQARGGQLVDVEVTVSAVSDRQGDLICLLSRDITSRKRAERDAVEHRRKLARLANHDALTGLPNRLFLQARLPRLLRRLADSKRMLAVFYVDMDHFKDINDSRGHPFGDKLLRIFSRRLKAAVGAHDVVVRMGGDEFVVVASLIPDVSSAELIAQRLVITAQAPIIIDDVTITVTASVGVAVYPQHALDTETLLKHADIALYQAKQAGRNGYKLFTSDMNVEISEQVALEQALRHALGSIDELYVEYQPIIDLRSGRLVSLEALVRWRHPEVGLVPPSRFIPIAEKTGLIVGLGEFVLRSVMRQLQAWQRAALPLVPVAVNISPIQLQRINLAALVNQLLREFTVESKWLKFEITESAVIHDSREAVVALQTLRELGSQVVIDDFGTGFATLGHLKNLPVDGVKIDKGFVAEVTRDASDVAIVSGIVSMAHDLHLYTVAEGIERSEQLAKLRELGCDQGQGYYFTRAVAAAGCEQLLSQLGDMQDPPESVQRRVLRRQHA